MTAVERVRKVLDAQPRVCFGEGFGEHRDWFVEQVKDRGVGGVPKWLR